MNCALVADDAHYFMTEYKKQATVLHERGKLMAGHMDGRAGVLKGLIAKTPINIVKGLTSPPMGDLTIVGSTLSLEGRGCLDWPSRVGVYPWARSSEEACSEPSKRGWLRRRAIVIELCKETHLSDENLLLLTSVLENAVLPLKKEKILVNNDGK